RPPLMSAGKKTLIVVSILRGEVTMADAARREGVSQTSIAKWRDRFLAGGQAALSAGSHSTSSRETRLVAEVEELTSALGEAHMELRLWRKKGALYPATRNSKRNADPLG
ncbi:MAG: helix-turn-helix domain-containing protein, partial [Actinomycetota bacterium]|nr:helix-turn-helix domain-containing protein [Actinomycetota bacterium]